MSADAPRIVRANGIDLACLESGHGPLVLLLHGFPDTARSWDMLRPRLAARGFHVVAPYLPGYDPSGLPPRDCTAELLGQTVVGLLDALQAPTARIVGHDWGALAAHAAVALAEGRFTHLATLAIPHPAGFKPTLAEAWRARHFLTYKLPGAHTRFAANDFAGLREIVARWSPTWTPPPGELDDVRRAFSNPASLDAAFGYYRAVTATPAAFLRQKLTLPTLAIAGVDDGAAPLRAFEESRGRYLGSYTVETVPGGHFPHREAPEQVALLLEAFLGTGVKWVTPGAGPA